jgi:glycine cleavage system H protein
LADYEIPDDLQYSEEDEWARVEEDDRVVVGITDYAQQQLGDIVFVELPEPGATYDKGNPFGVVESVKAVSDLYAPLSGEIVEVNEELVDRPEAVNEECYDSGWMVVFAPSDPDEIGTLLDAEAYRKHVDERAE